MQKQNIFQDVDSLIEAISTILSNDRCSFSDEEKAQLSNTIRYLENSKIKSDTKPSNLEVIEFVIKQLFRVFTNIDDLSTFF